MGQCFAIPAAVLALLVFVGTTVQAQNFEDGIMAFQTGDFAAAHRHLRPLALSGHPTAQAALGRMHEYGRGFACSDAEAARWYGRAAAQGLAFAQYRLAVLNDNGWGLPVDDVAAARWYERAAEQGHGLAQHNLAFMYADGTGVARNPVRAYMWLKIAVSQGNGIMAKHLARVGAQMTAAEIGQAGVLARDWLAGHTL